MEKKMLCTLMVLAGCLVSCTDANISEGLQPADAISIETDDNTQRDICEIVKITDKFFEAENVKHEIYRIDSQYLDERDIGDKVIIMYNQKTKQEDGTYTLDISDVHNYEDNIIYPAG